METVLFIGTGIILGIVIGFLYGKVSRNDIIEKEKEFFGYKATAEAQLKSLESKIEDKNKEIIELKEDISKKLEEMNSMNNTLAKSQANNEALNEKLDNQKKELEELGKRLNLEFENIANKILETKTEKFTELNKNNLKAILEPLGSNIDEFKKIVNETYDKESKERFSLGEKVKELAMLNQVISTEAKNLTNALKTQSKTQGMWGEMILETEEPGPADSLFEASPAPEEPEAV